MNDLTGQVFGRLTVVERQGKDRWGNATWQCRCECGTYKVVQMGLLTAGHTKSCGCLAAGSNKGKAITITPQERALWRKQIGHFDEKGVMLLCAAVINQAKKDLRLKDSTRPEPKHRCKDSRETEMNIADDARDYLTTRSHEGDDIWMSVLAMHDVGKFDKGRVIHSEGKNYEDL